MINFIFEFLYIACRESRAAADILPSASTKAVSGGSHAKDFLGLVDLPANLRGRIGRNGVK